MFYLLALSIHGWCMTPCAAVQPDLLQATTDDEQGFWKEEGGAPGANAR